MIGFMLNVPASNPSKKEESSTIGMAPAAFNLPHLLPLNIQHHLQIQRLLHHLQRHHPLHPQPCLHLPQLQQYTNIKISKYCNITSMVSAVNMKNCCIIWRKINFKLQLYKRQN